MAPIRVAVINESTVLTDADIKPVVEALQAQVREDFSPIWKIDADLVFVPTGGDVPMDSWWLPIFDHSDQADTLGYHDLQPLGFPMGKIFAADDMKAGTSWTNTASHELLEMLADPEICECTLQYLPDGKMRLVAREICDPVSEDSHGYQKGGILVADFVTRDWFVAWSQTFPGVKYDFRGILAKPFQLADQGYIGVMDVERGATWTQINERQVPHRRANTFKVGARRERRRIPKDQWKKSTKKNVPKAP
jgi:hypothetical protein